MELMTREIFRLEDADAVQSAWPVVRQLRPHLDPRDLVAAWQVQTGEGYRAIGAYDMTGCIGFAGYRIQHMLAHGRVLYVDDLVTAESSRGSGVGKQLMTWLIDEAQNEGCASLQLDSGTQRLAAHSFYFKRDLQISAFHFCIELEPGDATAPKRA